MDIKIILKSIYNLLAVFCMLGGFVFWVVVLNFVCDWLIDTREIRKQIVQEKYLTNNKLCGIIKSNKIKFKERNLKE